MPDDAALAVLPLISICRTEALLGLRQQRRHEIIAKADEVARHGEV